MGRTLSEDRGGNFRESLTIAHLPVVEPEGLLIASRDTDLTPAVEAVADLPLDWRQRLQRDPRWDGLQPVARR